jgi:uncharacterized protein YprB with RNaseH-like and TPR domain
MSWGASAASTPATAAITSPATLAAPPGPPLDGARAQRLKDLRARIDALMVREAARPARIMPAPEPMALPATPRDTVHGLLHVCAADYEGSHRHGDQCVGAFRSSPAELVAKLALDPGLAELDLSRLLFFDLETTGLAGGTGTLPFIVGLAWLEGDGIRVEQLFLRRPGEEGPMLGYVAERVAAASALVSFNGKSFDWPLLRARFVINRLAAPEPTHHVDLLHCARRVFKQRLPQMRLGQLERDVLGFERVDDIDGALIPASYFAYLRDGDGGGLAPVFTHNAHDLLALAAVLGRLCSMFAEVCDDDPRDHLGLARVAARAGDVARALSFATAAAEHPSGRFAVAGLRLAAATLRRQGEHVRAATLLERALAEAPPGCADVPLIRLELAKLYEHKLRDLERALLHAAATVPAEDGVACARRVARLLARCERRVV